MLKSNSESLLPSAAGLSVFAYLDAEPSIRVPGKLTGSDPRLPGSGRRASTRTILIFYRAGSRLGPKNKIIASKNNQLHFIVPHNTL